MLSLLSTPLGLTVGPGGAHAAVFSKVPGSVATPRPRRLDEASYNSGYRPAQSAYEDAQFGPMGPPPFGPGPFGPDPDFGPPPPHLSARGLPGVSSRDRWQTSFDDDRHMGAATSALATKARPGLRRPMGEHPMADRARSVEPGRFSAGKFDAGSTGVSRGRYDGGRRPRDMPPPDMPLDDLDDPPMRSRVSRAAAQADEPGRRLGRFTEGGGGKYDVVKTEADRRYMEKIKERDRARAERHVSNIDDDLRSPEREDRFRRLDEQPVRATVVDAVRELADENRLLTDEVRRLEARNVRLESRLDALEKVVGLID